MSSLTKTFVALISSRLIVAITGLVTMPLFLKLLGAHDFGVVGFFLTLQVLVNFLDLGMGTALIRKISTFRLHESLIASNYAKAFEAIYFVMAICIAAILYFLSPSIAEHWLNAKSALDSDLAYHLRLAAFCVCLNWFSSIHAAMMTGLERQYQLAFLQAIFALLRAFVPLASLYWYGISLSVFFISQLAVAVLQVVWFRATAYKYLQSTSSDWISNLKLIKEDLGFATGMFGITITTLLVTQTDRLILSKMLSLSDFGLYALCVTLASGIYIVVQPLFNLLYPRFNRLITEQDQSELTRLFHLGAQIVATLILPISALLIVFAPEVLWIWTAQESVVEQGTLILRLMVAANAINAVMNLPYCLQLATGWTSLALKVNIFALFLMLPVMVWGVNSFGAAGGAAVALMLHVCILIFVPRITFARFLGIHPRKWLINDTMAPLLGCLLVMLPIAAIGYFPLNRLLGLLALLLILILGSVAALLLASQMRIFIQGRIAHHYSILFKKGELK